MSYICILIHGAISEQKFDSRVTCLGTGGGSQKEHSPTELLETTSTTKPKNELTRKK